MEKMYKGVVEWNNLSTGQADRCESLIVIKDMKQELGKKISIRKMLIDIFGDEYLIEHGWPAVDERHTTVTWFEVEE